MRDGQLFTTCDTQAFPDIVFRVGGVDVMARSIDLINEDHIDDMDWDDNVCGTHLRRINAPFNVLGLPVLVDYKVVFQHDENYMSFGYGGNRAKEVPAYAYENERYAKDLVMPSYDWERSDNPAGEAALVTFILYLVIAAIPMTAGAYYWASTESSDEILYIVIGTSLVLTWPIAQFLIYPALFRFYNRASEESDIRPIDDALWEMYGI